MLMMVCNCACSIAQDDVYAMTRAGAKPFADSSENRVNVLSYCLFTFELILMLITLNMRPLNQPLRSVIWCIPNLALAMVIKNCL